MARVIVSSSALYTQLGAHLGAQEVVFRVGGQRVSLWSEEFTNSLPCETMWTGTAKVGLEKLLAALCRVHDQPITLDLHSEGPCRLYAYGRRPPGPDFGYYPIEFEL